jgi:hypothetical protein
MAQRAEVSLDTLAKLRSVCCALPEAYEESAWVGSRWRVRKQTFAHVLVIDDGWPPVYAKTAGTDGPSTVLTFQSEGQDLAALSNIGHPFFRPRWRPNIVGMFVDDAADWAEIGELLTESYCLLAPAKLVQRVGRPAD